MKKLRKKESMNSLESLQKSESRLRRAELASRSGCWELHLDSQIMYASYGAEKLYGVYNDQFEYAIIKEITLPQYRPFLDTALKNLTEDNIPYDVEFKIKTADTGEIKDIHSVATFDKEHRIVFGITQDITERKQEEEHFKESQHIIESIINSIPARVFWKDKNLVYLGCNTLFANDAGFSSPKDIIGKDDFQMGWSKVAKLYRSDDMQVIISKKPKLNYDELQITAEGNEINLLTSKTPLLNNQGEVTGIIGTYLDITKRRQAELALKESESSLRESQKLARMGSWTLNLIDQITEWSENNFIIYGYKPFEFIPTLEHFKNRVHPDDWNIVEKDMDFVFKNKVDSISEIRIILPDGTIKWFQNNVVPILQNDKVVKLIGINLDITESKLTQLVLKENRNKLIQLNADKDRFISILGHDLKNPFNNILGFSEILTDEIDSLNKDEIKDIAKDIHKSAQITNKLLEDILMWARTQQGKIPFKPHKISFTEICKNIIETLKPNADAKNITIDYSAPMEIIIFADNDMLKTVLRNLVSNAIKFTNNSGVINISAEVNSENVTISVSDNGIGIPSENLAKLFDISEVLSTKGTAGETGTGLGLLLCKEFVEKHGGKIWVESTVGEGCDFKFTLPVFNEQSL